MYLYELRDGPDAQRIIGSWIDFYNEVRPHSSLGGRTPVRPIAKARRCGEAIRRDATQPAQRRLRSSRDLRAEITLPTAVFPSGQSRREGGDYKPGSKENTRPQAGPRALETIRIHLKIAPGCPTK